MTNAEYHKIMSEIKMRLSELSQKLNNDEELCLQVAHLIDITIESRDTIEYVSQFHSAMPTIQKKLNNIITICSNDVKQCQEETTNNILTYLHKSGKTATENYIYKIAKSISYCIDNYEIYKTSDYAKRYSQRGSGSPANLNWIQLLEL